MGGEHQQAGRCRARVLIVDDDEDLARALAAALADEYACVLASDAAHACALFHDTAPHVVLSDVHFGADVTGGIDLLSRLQRSDPNVPVILMTGFGSIDRAVEAMRRGAFEYVTKPLESADLRALVERALAARGRASAPPPASGGERPPPSSEPRTTRGGTVTAATVRAEIVAHSPAMRAVLQRIELVAQSTSPVLVLGESGTGKELVARAIHALGPRHARPFVAVNAAAIPETLLESEVFGHVRGAFTGATQARRGLLTEADGGTMLLDEVGDMPIGLQPKLLRVLQMGEVRQVGADSVRHVDVRIVAATHRDLPALISEGRFRDDLFYRLNVVPIHVPPLRERVEDIPELAKRFLAYSRKRTPASPVTSFSEEALAVLAHAPWRGNVRELASVVERVVVLGVRPTVEASDLLDVQRQPPSTPLPEAQRGMWTLRQLNDTYVEWVLAQSGGSKAHAAKVLGVDLSTLYRWRRAKGR